MTLVLVGITPHTHFFRGLAVGSIPAWGVIVKRTRELETFVLGFFFLYVSRETIKKSEKV